ncbi:MAG: DUF2127 domain-containing protein [Minisyncoccia bacterium]
MNRERNILWLFDFALVIKIISGAVEMLAGLLVVFVPPSFVLDLATLATNGELSRDSSDFVATTILGAAQVFAVHTHYVLATYLVLHGLVKVLLIIGIFAKKRIAYPLFMLALALFAAYTTYRGFVLHELLLQAIAIYDLSLLLLTSYEYRQRYPQKSSL